MRQLPVVVPPASIFDDVILSVENIEHNSNWLLFGLFGLLLFLFDHCSSIKTFGGNCTGLPFFYFGYWNLFVGLVMILILIVIVIFIISLVLIGIA